MAIAVCPDQPQVRTALITPCDSLDQVFGQRLVGRDQIGRNELVLEKKPHAVRAKGGDIQYRSVSVGLFSTDCMQSPDKPSELTQLFRIFKIRGASTASFKQGEAEFSEIPQRISAVIGNGWHQIYLPRRQIQRKGVLFQNRLRAPAVRTIELGDERVAVVQTQLIYPVLKTVHLEQAAITMQPLAFNGSKNLFRSKVLITSGRFGGLGHGGLGCLIEG